MNMSLLTAMFLLLRFLFQCLYCQFLEQISHLDLLLSVISFALSPEEATDVFFIKGSSLKYEIFRGKYLCWGLFLI